jgi:phosphate transport system protein
MTHLEEELRRLKEQMTEMSGLVTSQIKKSLDSLVDDDVDLAREVISNEKRVNAFELSIDKICENIFALLAPFANDMRFVFATLKINTDFERIGDNAEGIAKYVVLEGKNFDKQLLQLTQFPNMTATVNEMLSTISKAYAESNTKLARTIFTRDDILDDINRRATDIIASYIKENPENIHQALHLLTIIRKLERTGDHITNIAEEIIFYLEAKVLKHVKKSGQEEDNTII